MRGRGPTSVFIEVFMQCFVAWAVKLLQLALLPEALHALPRKTKTQNPASENEGPKALKPSASTVLTGIPGHQKPEGES